MSVYLIYEERLEIEAGLKEHKTFGEIGRQLTKDRTTVAKEIVILTDNGSEFKDAIGIEYNGSEIQRSRVFYCDPLASW